MKKVGICGFFSFDNNDHGGQPVKTRELYYALREYIKEDILYVDTYGWKKKPISLVIKSFILMIESNNIIIMPAKNGLKVFARMYSFMNIFLRRKLHYVVIGGWLPELLKENDTLCKSITRFDTVFVETNYMKLELERLGLDNIVILPNFKNIKPICKDDFDQYREGPYKLCTFSRVTPQKGIEEAIKVVTKTNKIFNKTIFTLDIYGQVEEHYVNKFNQMKSEFPNYIRYRGTIKPEKSVEVLKDYYALLFPTKYKTEGIPGTIIDSYFAGVPVISSIWDSFSDVIDEGSTGIGYEFNNEDKLNEILCFIAKHPEIIDNMRENCIKKSQEYTPQKVIEKLVSYL